MTLMHLAKAKVVKMAREEKVKTPGNAGYVEKKNHISRDCQSDEAKELRAKGVIKGHSKGTWKGKGKSYGKSCKGKPGKGVSELEREYHEGDYQEEDVQEGEIQALGGG